jgi:hypothetical protein
LTATACRRAFAPLVIALGTFACSSTSNPDATDGASPDDEGGLPCFVCADVSVDVAPLVEVRGTIDQICSNVDGCHGSGAGNLGLSEGHEFENLINVASSEEPTLKRVAPGDPEHSYAYLKVSCEAGIFGGCMPLNSGYSPVIAKAFRAWIEAGAPTQ